VAIHVKDIDKLEEKKVNDLGEVVSGVGGAVSGVDPKAIKNIWKWLTDTKSRILHASFICFGAIFMWFLVIKPVNNFNTVMTEIQKKQIKADTMLLLIHSDIKKGFGDVNNRFDNMDADFGTLIHYVAKDKNDEEYLRREIIDDHKNLIKKDSK
jgi:hypothetical protein